MKVQVRSNVANLSPYTPPWTGLDRSGYLRLDLNENTQPPPMVVNEALRELINKGSLQMYPAYEWFLPKLSRYTGVKKEQLLITNGSDQAIDIILRTFLEPGDGIVFAQPEFPIFSQVATVIGATIQGVPYEPDLTFPFERFMQTIHQKTRLIALINPNNPTGSTISLEEIEKILRKHPNLPVIVDEAYFEFTGITTIHLLNTHPNLIITRTFSKAFAMAGLRLGYILAHSNLINEFYKVRGPFDVNTCALYAAAAQIDTPSGWEEYVKEVMMVSKPFIETYFRQKGVNFFPGAANFLLVWPSDKNFAVDYLKQRGILVRPMQAPAIQKAFRMSVGTIEEMKMFSEAFDDFLVKSNA